MTDDDKNNNNSKSTNNRKTQTLREIETKLRTVNKEAGIKAASRQPRQ